MLIYGFIRMFRKKMGRIPHSYDNSLFSHRRGFTLIELLVVIAIIGILSSIVLTNLNSARQKARDVKRIADIKQLQLSLALYFDANYGKYPGQLSDLSPTYISPVPKPPAGAGQANYTYVPLNASCNSYRLGATLEQASNDILTNDADAPVGTVAAPAATACATPVPGTVTGDFNGTGINCDYGAPVGVPQGQPNATEQCFDVIP